MALGLVGRKVGMTRIFSEDGDSQPVTVVEVTPNRVTQVRTDDVDGYSALQVTAGERRPNRVSKPMKGHYAKAGVEPGRGVWEFRVAPDEMTVTVKTPVEAEAAEGEEQAEAAEPQFEESEVELKAGSEITVNLFAAGQYVDARARSKGRGFAGGIKRHGFGGGRATHGVSKAHRLPGSIGQNQTPGRVFKGKKMAGHMGDVNVTQQGLKIVKVDAERNLLLIGGSIPGSKGADVIVTPSIKNKGAAA